ncbi:polysaccharide biosynthesis/export family protein [Chthonobacter rhizosphaerae]|uniref:polysaccharide biosynthesis/export family protein n=1 Tax=Chthonobacter rhizosphaerae TaxID=2735553 RepID=UPI0015EF6058|nr:polysaccharide biosynthesis/export family protein [Chthonobacter rhizosphaerae]
MLLAAAFAVAAYAAADAASAGDYRLGPQDQLRLKVYEWRASRDQIFEWTALNDQFTVGADGAVFLPFVGEVDAGGLTTGELARAIGDRLMSRMGLGRQPDVSVEIAEYRPVFVSGDVTTPGAYPYRPGLTVLQAVSIAGGLRTGNEASFRFAREIIGGRGDIGLLDWTRTSLLLRKARLEAELAGADAIRFPEEAVASSDPSEAALMEQERLIFEARRDGLKNQTQALENLRDFFAQELVSLDEQLSLYDKRIALIRKELEGVSTLVNKGLAAAPRGMELERAIAEMQSERLSAETGLLRARQEQSRTEIAILELKNRFRNEVTVALRETQTQLDETDLKTSTAARLLMESGASMPRLRALRDPTAEARPAFSIVRPTAEGMAELPAEDGTPLEPGDTVKVDYLSDRLGRGQAGSAALLPVDPGEEPTVAAGPTPAGTN